MNKKIKRVSVTGLAALLMMNPMVNCTSVYAESVSVDSSYRVLRTDNVFNQDDGGYYPSFSNRYQKVVITLEQTGLSDEAKREQEHNIDFSNYKAEIINALKKAYSGIVIGYINGKVIEDKDIYTGRTLTFSDVLYKEVITVKKVNDSIEKGQLKKDGFHFKANTIKHYLIDSSIAFIPGREPNTPSDNMEMDFFIPITTLFEIRKVDKAKAEGDKVIEDSSSNSNVDETKIADRITKKDDTSSQTPIAWSIDVKEPKVKLTVTSDEVLDEIKRNKIMNYVLEANQDKAITKDMLSFSDNEDLNITYSDGSNDVLKRKDLVKIWRIAPRKAVVVKGFNWNSDVMSKLIKKFSNLASVRYEGGKTYEDEGIYAGELDGVKVEVIPSDVIEVIDVNWPKESFSELTGRLNNIRQYVETSELIKQKMLELNPKWKQKPKVLVQASHNGNLWWGVGATDNGMPWAGYDAKNESAITLIWYNDPKHDSDKENSDSDDAAYISIPTLNLIKPVNGFPNFEFKSAGLYADDSVYIRPITYDVGYINDGWQNWDATVAMSRLYNKSIGYKSKVDVFVEDKETGDKWQYKANAEDVFSSGKYPTILWNLPSYGLVGADFYKQITDYKGEYNTSMFVYPSEEHSHNKVNKDLIPYSKVISKMKNLSIGETEKYRVTVNPFVEFYFDGSGLDSSSGKNLYMAVNLYPVEKQGDKYSQVYDDLSEESVLSKVNFTTAITHPAPAVRFEIVELKNDIEPIVVNYEGTLKDKDLKRVGEALSKVNPRVLKFRLETTDNPDVIKMYNIFNRDPIEVDLKGKIVRKTLNESNQTPISWSVDVVVPHDKVYVANENTLTEQEKKAIKNQIVKVNQENRITKDMISVSDEGKATITYSDGSQDEISKDKLITNQKPKVDIAVGDDKPINNNVSVGVNTETNTERTGTQTEKVPSDKSTQTDKNTIDKGTQTDLSGRDIDKLKSDATRDNSIISELEKLKDELTRMNERSKLDIPRDVEIGQWYPDVMKRLPDKRSYIDGEDILLNGMQMIFSRYILVGNKYEKQTEVVNFSDFRNEYRGWKFNLKTPKAVLRDSEGGKMRVRFSFMLNNKNESMR